MPEVTETKSVNGYMTMPIPKVETSGMHETRPI